MRISHALVSAFSACRALLKAEVASAGRSYNASQTFTQRRLPCVARKLSGASRSTSAGLPRQRSGAPPGVDLNSVTHAGRATDCLRSDCREESPQPGPDRYRSRSRKTIAQLGVLLAANPSFYVSNNVRAEDLRSFRFLNLLTALLSRTGIAPRHMRIEATEHSFM